MRRRVEEEGEQEKDDEKEVGRREGRKGDGGEVGSTTWFWILCPNVSKAFPGIKKKNVRV